MHRHLRTVVYAFIVKAAVDQTGVCNTLEDRIGMAGEKIRGKGTAVRLDECPKQAAWLGKQIL